MNLKKYLVIDVINIEHYQLKLKLKIINGFTRDNIEHAMDIQTGWTPQGNDKLYFFPGCNVPRFKVRDKFACTIKLKNATAAFVSKDTMEGSESTFDYYKNLMPLNHLSLRKWMNNIRDEHVSGIFFSILKNGIDGIFATENLWMKHSIKESLHKHNISFKSALCCLEGDNVNRYTFTNGMKNNQYQLLGFNRKNNMDPDKISVYLEDDLLKHLNVGKLILTEEKYEELRAFGKTKEYDNQVLMMELMSNCDFEKSIVYLLFLLKEFGKNIEKLKEVKHVNFKSLLSYLKINPKKIKNIHINDITRILKKHKKFTRKNVGRLSMLCAYDHIDYNDRTNCWIKGPVLRFKHENELDK